MSLTLLIPEKVDTLQLSAAIKGCVAAHGHKVAISTSPGVDRVTLLVADGARQAALVEPNAIVRYLKNQTAEHNELITFEEEQLFPLVRDALRVDDHTAAALAPLLPEKTDSAAAVIAFGDLQALVMARGKPALAAEGTVMMWHQKLLQEPRVKLAMAPAMQAEYVRPAKKEAATPASVSTSSAGSVGAASKSAGQAEKVDVSQLIPKADGPTVDGRVALEKLEHPILPKKDARNVLITSALPYVNNVPHLGNIVGSTLSSDFYARYCKARGHQTLFVCGTDEYGTATETKALEEGLTPYELCTRYYHIHKQVYDWFEIEFDHFGRTSTPQQTEIAQDVFLRLQENGYLEEQTSTQLYCEKHQGFLADRYVEGTCPRCGFNDARGDQCDGCGQLLDPFELINPRCKLDDGAPVSRETKHMYLCLDKLQPQLEEWLKTVMPTWPQNAQSITKNWLKEGLKPRSITRDLKWGTPVPLAGYENKVLYVWFDAPIGYPSITATYTDQWEKWWKPEDPKSIKLLQFMGKDNAPFHAVVWPSCEIGTKNGWKLVDYLSTTEYLQYEGGKFSKSRNLGVFGNNAQETGIPPSVWRYYLANARPETGDSQFSWSDFVQRNNSELLANLGNYVNRVIKFAAAKFGSKLPLFTLNPKSPEYIDLSERVAQYIRAMEAVQLREGIELAMRFSARGNQYLQESKLDNTLLASDPQRCAHVVGTSLNYIYVLSALIYPYMPTTARQICEMLNAPVRTIPDAVDFALKPGHPLGAPQYLFTRIDPSKVDEWLAKYGGKDA